MKSYEGSFDWKWNDVNPLISRYIEIDLHLDDISKDINWLVYNIDP